MSETRLDKWKEEKRTGLFMTPDDEEISQIAKKRFAKLKAEGKAQEGMTTWSIVQSAKELIFDVREGEPVFHAIMFLADTARFELVLSHVLDIERPSEDDVKSTLAVAMALDVPVYPNTDDVAPVLAGYHRDLLIDGFKAKDESGVEKRYVLTKSPKDKIDSVLFLQEMTFGEMHTPAELLLMREAVMKEVARREEAGRALASLQLAIFELSELLTRTARNESELQECLTRNPILFGPEYVRVIPKHRLGAEYEMDYALERISGLVDLVEIEASTHNLFTKLRNERARTR